MPDVLRAGRIALSPDRIIHDGVLIHEQGRVTAVGPAAELLSELDPASLEQMVDYGDRTVAPAPINAHAHLELSHMKGVTQLGQGFTAWVISLLGAGIEAMNGCSEAAVDVAVEQLAACGVAHIADVSSRNPELVAASLRKKNMGMTLLAEAFGFAPLKDADALLPHPFLNAPEWLLESTAIAGHALYSTSPERMQAAKAWCAAKGRVFSLHLAEHEGEVGLLTSGEGEFANLLRSRLLPKGWEAPGLRPVAFADSLGLLDAATLAVHCVQVAAEEVHTLARRGVTVCLCPRSNAAIGVGNAPVAAYRAAGVNLCLGTDSLASNTDLDIWQELRHILNDLQAAGEPLPTMGEVVAWTSANAARVLGLQGEEGLGGLETGNRAVWTLVPSDLEYLS